ncbi:MAG: helix-turn-helix domain-containing protein, partial [Geobacteraceae bacterium]
REQAKSASELRKALSLLLIAELGLDSDKAAEILGTSKRTVFRNRRNICSQDGTSQKTWGGRRNCSMIHLTDIIKQSVNVNQQFYLRYRRF